MNNGKIHGNTAIGAGAAQGGVIVHGLFEMNGGQITDNQSTLSAGGVSVNGAGTFIMNGGEISENTATSGTRN
ncbi:MAG: hypothetical protein FWC79_08775 [Oscillospiraceae bacterium]|nr:hypothetical protein [Oscillospiraceae bacterium]